MLAGMEGAEQDLWGSAGGPASESGSTYQSAWVGKFVSGRSSATRSITEWSASRLR